LNVFVKEIYFSMKINNKNNKQYITMKKPMTNGNHQQELSNDINSEENNTDTIPLENNIPLISDIQNNSEDIPISTDEIPQLTETLTNDNNQIEPSLDISVNNNNVVEQSTNVSINDNNEVEQITTNTIEPLSNGDHQEEPPANIIDEKPILSDSSSISDEKLDDNEDKPKLHHSDSLYLLRKKVQNENDNTSDDESQLSSTIESPQEQQIIDGV